MTPARPGDPRPSRRSPPVPVISRSPVRPRVRPIGGPGARIQRAGVALRARPAVRGGTIRLVLSREALEQAIDTLRRSPQQALIALDFDGTLAPIVADPAQSRLGPGAAQVLSAEYW